MTDIDITLTSKLRPFLTKKKRFKGAFGGRGGTKSQSIADILLAKVATEGIKVGCFREHQNTIEDSVHSLLEEEINRLQIPRYKIDKTNIMHEDGGRFRFRGLSRNIAGIKSFHGFKIFWLEEAQFISDRSLKMLTPTLRTEDSECWFTFNPQSRLDPISQRFILPFIKELRRDGVYEDDLHYIVWTNYDENPWFPESLEAERQRDYKVIPRAEYDHIWLGHFNDSIENAIITAEWFDACIDAHKRLGFEPEGIVTVAHDPSDSGYDDKGLALRHGSVVLDVQLNKSSDVNNGLDWAMGYAIEHGADYFTWDADGLGLGLKRQVADVLKGEKIDYDPFRGSEGVDFPSKVFNETGKNVTDARKQRTNKQALMNKRAQYYWNLRNRCYNTYLAINYPEFRYQPVEDLVSFNSEMEEIDQLRAELCKIPRVPNANGKIQIMSKKDMKAKDIESPNLADSVMMSFRLPKKTGGDLKIDYKNPWGKA